MAYGILDRSQPMSGYLTGRKLAMAEDQNQMAQMQGVLGIQGALQQQQDRQRAVAADRELSAMLTQMPEIQSNPVLLAQAKTAPRTVLPMVMPKQPKWQATEIRQPDGQLKKGYVDINSPNPESTFRPLGVEPVKKEHVYGQFVNPYTQDAPVNNPNAAFNAGPGGTSVPNPVVQKYELGKARTGATNISVNTERSFLGDLSKEVGGQVARATEQAKAAAGTLGTVTQIRQALDSGRVVSGPGTTPIVVLNQIGEVIGVNGADATERLNNTRKAIQGLAQLELDAAQQMKGQGQITEAERAIIRRAASGDIDGMTNTELRTLMDSLDRTARYKIRMNQKNVDRLKTNPNAAPIVQFMEVVEPEEYQPRRRASDSQPEQPVLKYNPRTGRIE